METTRADGQLRRDEHDGEDERHNPVESILPKDRCYGSLNYEAYDQGEKVEPPEF